MDFGFNPLQYKYPSRRSVMYGTKGMVCSSQPLAAQAGLDMIKKGGNAVDAAVCNRHCAYNFRAHQQRAWQRCLCQVWVGGKLYGLNGSGYAPEL